MKKVLYVRVAEPQVAFMARTRAHAARIDLGKKVEPLIEVGFYRPEEMVSVLTPKRWGVIEELRASGPVTISELARRLQRNYKNVHEDCERLMEWLVVEKDASGRVHVPYSEIVIDMKLPGRAAA